MDPLGTVYDSAGPFIGDGELWGYIPPLRPPNAFEQQQINNVYEGMINTGDPVLQRIAERLQDRKIMVDESLVMPAGQERGTGATSQKYLNPNTINLSPDLFSNAPYIKSGSGINTLLMEYLIHEDLHLMSRYDITGWGG